MDQALEPVLERARTRPLQVQLGDGAEVRVLRFGAQALEPHLGPVFRHALHWTGAASITNPLAVTRAYAARFSALGGIVLRADARSLHRSDGRWRLDVRHRHTLYEDLAGPVGAPSRWITLRALRVLAWYDGLA